MMRNREADLATDYVAVRGQTLRLIDGLSAEDCMLQSMPDASPVKWHIAHVTWFFEVFILADAEGLPSYRPFDPIFRVIFNSYYEGVGPRHPRPERGMLSRPSLDTVLRYRRHVDARMLELLARPGVPERLLQLTRLGLHHEQQHQELILTDLKHHLSRNPLAMGECPPRDPGTAPPPLAFIDFDGGLGEIGHTGPGFAFDNETPRHRVWIESFALANRPVTNGEYLEFMQDGGYTRPELWLSDGWDVCRQQGWQAPLYWDIDDREGRVFTLQGMDAPDWNAPVCHLSYYEAEAYARWAGARLPTEAEWEHAAGDASAQDPAANFLESGFWRPRPAAPTAGLQQMLGDVWEWTQSAYLPYPGFRPAAGAVGEYNGKFMINQMVLRGGSCATPRSHIRSTYRNFFPPAARWQFSGVRLAR